MQLRQLEHIIALAEERNFARAAQRVHLSQPAFSRSIQGVEQALELKLFDRTTRDVTVTAAGRVVLQRARRVLFEGRCLLRDVDLLKHSDLGSLDFGAAPYPAAVLLPAALDDLARHHPQLRIHVTVDNGMALLDRVRHETLDFAITDVRAIPTGSEFEIVKLPRLRGTWFVRNDHPLARQPLLEVQHLRQFPIVSVPLPDHMRQTLRKWLRFPAGHELEFQLTCNDVPVLQQYARRTDALVLLPVNVRLAQAVEEGPGSLPRLVPLFVPNQPPLTFQFGIFHLAGRTRSPAADRALMAMQRAAAAEA